MVEANHTRLINSKLPTLAHLSEHFGKNLPEEWFYKPVAVEIEMTHVCNLRCAGCAIIEDVEKGYDGFSVDKIISFLKECADTSVYCYALTGGEPLVFMDRVCRIIAESPIDILKIHTNGKPFTTEKRAVEILRQLKEAGFGTKNRHVNPTLNVSLGLQTEAGTPVKNVAILAKTFFEVFPFEANLVVNVTPYRDEDVPILQRELEDAYFQLTGSHFPYYRITGEHFVLQFTPRLAEKTATPVNWIPIRERIAQLEGWQDCFNSPSRNTPAPMPRMILRADGTLYSCCSFGFTGKTGNVHETSLFSLLEKMNQNPKFELVLDKGIASLYENVRAVNPAIDEVLIPDNYNVCKVCKVLREPRELDPVKEPIRDGAAYLAECGAFAK